MSGVNGSGNTSFNNTEFSSISQYLKDIATIPIIDPVIETELLAKAKAGDKASQAAIVQGNLRLVIIFAKRYTGRGVPFIDLIQAGNIGLYNAVKKFDIGHGCRFSTYASTWIKQKIIRTIENESRTVRIPSYLQDSIRRVIRYKYSKLGESTERLTNKQAVDQINEANKGKNIQDISYERILSATRVDRVITHEHDDTLPVFDEKLNTGSTGSTLNQNVLKEDIEILQRSFVVLSERDRKIVKMRFGIDCDQMQLEEIGLLLDPVLTKERIRQIVRDSLFILKVYMEQHGSNGEDI